MTPRRTGADVLGRFAPLVHRAPGLAPRVHGALVDMVFASPGSVALSGAIASVAIGTIAWTTVDPIIAILLLAMGSPSEVQQHPDVVAAYIGA